MEAVASEPNDGPQEIRERIAAAVRRVDRGRGRPHRHRHARRHPDQPEPGRGARDRRAGGRRRQHADADQAEQRPAGDAARVRWRSSSGAMARSTSSASRPPDRAMSDETPPAAERHATLEIKNRLGLHARAAVLLVQTAKPLRRRRDGVQGRPERERAQHHGHHDAGGRAGQQHRRHDQRPAGGARRSTPSASWSRRASTRPSDRRAGRAPRADSVACPRRRRSAKVRRHAQGLRLHVRVGERRSPRQGLRPDLRRHRRRAARAGSRQPHRLRSADQDGHRGGGGRDHQQRQGRVRRDRQGRDPRHRLHVARHRLQRATAARWSPRSRSSRPTSRRA